MTRDEALLPRALTEFADADVRRHERRNALHTLQGLLELARHARERPGSFTEPAGVPLAEVGEIVKRVGHRVVRAQLVGKLLAAQERGVRLRISHDTCLPGDIEAAGEVVTVVGNLIDNALDAVAGTVCATPTVEVALRRGRDAIELRVSDNGTGVDPHLRQWIFDRGASTKRSTAARPRGIGLSLVRAITEARCGSVTVADREGGGAVFTVSMGRRS
ncbi:ATP-binding protein [Streptomyces sp. NPDC029554]|uniref:sensor histidine kinase n=1 Tax=Streptomyces sp. NPDC029554 TaxID=3155126 RepID=UPI0033C50849